MDVRRVHHLGFVVTDLRTTLHAWESLLGVKAEVSENPELQVRLGAIEIGGVRLVFNESTQPGSRWERFLHEHGEGLEHIALEVEDIEAAARATQVAGLPLRFPEHKLLHGFLTNFVDRQYMHATAVELQGPSRGA